MAQLHFDDEDYGKSKLKRQSGGLDSFALPALTSPEMDWWHESMKSHPERIAWWREARFGMFVHWGIYSELGNVYKGQPGSNYSEFIQATLKIPMSEYRGEVASRFNPVHFDADRWIQAAMNAGMGYFIVTAKHSDGFALWPSEANDYNMRNCTPFSRDPIKELRESCVRHGVKFGCYYSHSFDWGDPNAPGNDWEYGNPGVKDSCEWWLKSPDFHNKVSRYISEKCLPQLRELLRAYDPDILWFDVPNRLPPSENLRIMRAVREASPHVVINGRIVDDLGDYASTCDRPEEFPSYAGDWESIPTTNESYGWNQLDLTHKTPEHFIQLLAKAMARGGNTLLNVGPMGDGRMDPKDLAILEGIGRWWEVYGESIRGCDRTPLAVQSWGESTRKGNRLCLHVFRWPTDGKLVVGGLLSKGISARLLTGRGKPSGPELKVSRHSERDICIEGLPIEAPHPANSIITLETEDEIQVDSFRLLQPAYRLETLRVFDAELKGEGLRFGKGQTANAHVVGWSRAGQSIEWSVRLNEPAAYHVSLVYDASPAATGAPFEVTLGSQALAGRVQPGKKYELLLGNVTLQPEDFKIRLWTDKSDDGELMSPRKLLLERVA